MSCSVCTRISCPGIANRNACSFINLPKSAVKVTKPYTFTLYFSKYDRITSLPAVIRDQELVAKNLFTFFGYHIDNSNNAKERLSARDARLKIKEAANDYKLQINNGKNDGLIAIISGHGGINNNFNHIMCSDVGFDPWNTDKCITIAKITEQFRSSHHPRIFFVDMCRNIDQDYQDTPQITRSSNGMEIVVYACLRGERARVNNTCSTGISYLLRSIKENHLQIKTFTELIKRAGAKMKENQNNDQTMNMEHPTDVEGNIYLIPSCVNLDFRRTDYPHPLIFKFERNKIILQSSHGGFELIESCISTTKEEYKLPTKIIFEENETFTIIHSITGNKYYEKK
eukprot:449354_1